MAKRVGNGLTDTDGNPDGEQDDFFTDGVQKLIAQFRDKKRIRGVLQSWLERCDNIESALWDLFINRVLEVAEGVNLDTLGAIVGQPRSNLVDDDQYRVFIKARIKVNVSNGRPEELLQICRLLFGELQPVELREFGAAHVRIKQPSVLTLPLHFVGEFLARAKAAAVRLRFQYFLNGSADSGLYIAFTDDDDSLDAEHGLGDGIDIDAGMLSGELPY